MSDWLDPTNYVGAYLLPYKAQLKNHCIRLHDIGGLIGLWLDSTQVPHCQRVMASFQVIIQYENMAPILVGLWLQNSKGGRRVCILDKRAYGMI